MYENHEGMNLTFKAFFKLGELASFCPTTMNLMSSTKKQAALVLNS